MIRVGELVGSAKLTNAFDAYAIRVLSDCFEVERGQSKGGRNSTKYRITKPLPNKEDYEPLKRVRFTTTADSLAADAFSEIETLAEEMREWYDNMPEGFQQGDTGSRLDEAASTLEGIQAPDEPDCVKYIEVYSLPHLKCTSRADRCSEAVGQLQQVAETIQDWINEHRPKDQPDTSTVQFFKMDEKVIIEVDWNELESFMGECSDAASEAEGVDFPGKFG